jgi:pimeloyl-ACP methyl ester carboxylesterase
MMNRFLCIGGGGIPVSSLESEAVRVVSALNVSVSIYVTDKRGVGQSSLLKCPTSIIKNFTACLPFIQTNQYRLKQNTYTNTAHDLKYVLNVIMGNNRENLKPNQRVVLMPSSQGTYLVQRYFHLTEDSEQVDAVILDSPLPTDMPILIYGDTYLNYMFLDLFTRCSQDHQGCANYFEDHNPIRALYTYKMNEDFQDNSSCLYLLNTNTTDLANKV